MKYSELLCVFYRENPEAMKKVDVILSKKSNVTLRVIDWFITTYCKNLSKSLYYVYRQYKLRLKSYSKKLFDPFCRGFRIRMLIEGQRLIETTVGQLNFFKWIIEDNIIQLYEKNIEDVNKYMLNEGFKIKLKGRGRKKKKQGKCQPLVFGNMFHKYMCLF